MRVDFKSNPSDKTLKIVGLRKNVATPGQIRKMLITKSRFQTIKNLLVCFYNFKNFIKMEKMNQIKPIQAVGNPRNFWSSIWVCNSQPL